MISSKLGGCSIEVNGSQTDHPVPLLGMFQLGLSYVLHHWLISALVGYFVWTVKLLLSVWNRLDDPVIVVVSIIIAQWCI